MMRRTGPQGGGPRPRASAFVGARAGEPGWAAGEWRRAASGRPGPVAAPPGWRGLDDPQLHDRRHGPVRLPGLAHRSLDRLAGPVPDRDAGRLGQRDRPYHLPGYQVVTPSTPRPGAPGDMPLGASVE